MIAIPTRRFVALALLAADLLALLLSLIFALLLLWVFRYERIGGDFFVWWGLEGYGQALAFVLLGIYCCLQFWIKGHYEKRIPFWDELFVIVQVLFGASMLNIMVVFLMHGSLSRFMWPISWGLVLCFTPLLRGVARRCLIRLGHWSQPVLILGVGENAEAAWRALNSEARLGFNVQGFVQLPGATPLTSLPAPVTVIQKKQILSWFEQRKGAHLIVALEASEMEHYASVVEQLALSTQDMFLVPPVSGMPLVGLTPQHFFRQEVLMLAVHNNLENFPRQVFKRGFDVFCALAGLTLLAPLFVFLFWRIRCDGGSALYDQERVGRGGRKFRCLKFRTMVPDSAQALERLLQTDAAAMDEWRLGHKLKHDPRITSIGRFLRSSSLDELPQLWNVLRGEMSLVGPRPVVPEELECYGERVDLYLQVRPGMSGLWQVSGRNNTSYEERVSLDAWYIKNWSLWYDIVIICKTVRVVFNRQGAY